MSSDEHNLILMNRARMTRTIKRMAYQIAETVKEKRVVLVGLNERGYSLASRLSNQLKAALSRDPVLLQLDRSRAEADGAGLIKSAGLDQTVLILVDDVIFTGETMFEVLRNLPVESADSVYVAVLVDRGNRRYPIASRFIGLEIPTKPREHVDVLISEGDDQVLLYRK